MAVALYGLLYSAPSAHFWQLFVQRLFCMCGGGGGGGYGSGTPSVGALKICR